MSFLSEQENIDGVLIYFNTLSITIEFIETIVLKIALKLQPYIATLAQLRLAISSSAWSELNPVFQN